MNNIKNFEFTIDWKYSAEDVMWNIQKIVKNFPVKFIGEREEHGDWYEVVECNGKEFKFKVDSENGYEGLEKIINFTNEHLPDQNTKFVLLSGNEDSYIFGLIRVK